MHTEPWEKCTIASLMFRHFIFIKHTGILSIFKNMHASFIKK